MEPKRIYFPALDGLRFIAFLTVFIHHVTFYINPSLVGNPILRFFRVNGWIGVDIFFVLSGFLVTLLLLEERKKRGNFSYKNFFLRRVIRIWPLYFLALIFGYLIFPNILLILGSSHTWPNLASDIKKYLPWHLIFLGNINTAFLGWESMRGVSQLWAISLEQQFYIIWPIFLFFIKKLKTAFITTILLILVAIGLRIVLVNSGVNHPGIYTNTLARIDSLMFGVILGFVLFFKGEFINKLANISRFYLLILIGFIIFLFFSTANNTLAIRNGIFGYLVTGIFSLITIIVCIQKENIITKLLSNKVLLKLGRLSYGLYIWHVFALEFLAFLILPTGSLLPLLILGFILTLALAYLSYNLFEKFFLKFKKY